MIFTIIRSLTGSSTPHRGTRPTHVLTSGAVISIHKQGSALACQYSTNRTSWTQKFTYTPTNWDGSFEWAAALDESDNIHLIWFTTADSIRYVKFTHAAAAWTAGSVENVTTTGPSDQGSLAVEAMASGAIVAAWTARNSSTSTNLNMYCRRTSDSLWVQFANEGVTGTGGDEDGGLSIARDAAGATSNEQALAYWWRPGKGLPQKVGVMTINVSTGARTAWAIIDGNAMDRNASAAAGDLYSYTPGRWRFVGFMRRFQSEKWAFEINLTSYVHRPVRRAMSYVDFCSTSYAIDRGAILYKSTSSSRIYASYIFFSPFGIDFGHDDDQIIPLSGVLDWLGGGGNRNFISYLLDFILGQGSTRICHSYADPPSDVPKNIKPAAGSIVNTSFPRVEATHLLFSGLRYRVQWEIAPDNTFTTGTVAESEPVEFYFNFLKLFSWLKQNGSTTMTFGTRIPQGTKWIRARLINHGGRLGPPSAAHSFTISHPPSATNLSPSNDTTRGFGDSGIIPLTWSFTSTSPGDTQTAYQVVVEVNSDGTPVLDTGKVVSTSNGGTVTIPASFKDLLLRWKVMLWDNDDVSGDFSGYSTFRVADSPTVTILTPGDDSTIDNPAPLVTWTAVLPGGRTQYSYTVTILDELTRVPLYSFSALGDDTSHTPEGAVMENLKDYVITVSIVDSFGLSGEASHIVHTQWTPPLPFSAWLDSTAYITHGYMKVSWITEALDDTYIATRIYRRENGDDATREMVYEVNDPTVLEYHDWFALAGNDYEYYVVQVAERFGVYLESTGTWLGPARAASADYWLLHPEDESLHVRLHMVTEDSFTEEWESETLNLIGRGRKKDYGTRYGYVGSLRASIRNDWLTGKTAREQRFNVEQARPGLRYLRNPFGDLWKVSVGDIQFSRIAGVGEHEFVDVTLPYEEVQ